MELEDKISDIIEENSGMKAGDILHLVRCIFDEYGFQFVHWEWDERKNEDG